MSEVSEKQQRFFQTFGFLPLKKYLPNEEMSCLASEFDAAMEAELAKRGSRKTICNLSRILMGADTPLLASLADDSRFLGASEKLLQRSSICIQVSGQFYMGNTSWHSDNYDLSYCGVKFAIYLDRLDASCGALRLMPGTHRNPLWQKSLLTHHTEEVFGVRPEEMPAYVFASEPGDVIAFQHSLWHASFNGAPFRRILAISYYADPITSEETRDFTIQMDRNHRPSAKQGLQLYPDYWRSSANEKHRCWVERLRELGVLETPIS